MKTLICVVMCVLLSGCADFQKLADEEDKIIVAARETAIRCHRNSSFRMGFIDGGLEDIELELPIVLAEAKEQLVQLSQQDPNTMTDYELGYYWVRSLSFSYRLTKWLANRYVPELGPVMRYLP